MAQGWSSPSSSTESEPSATRADSPALVSGTLARAPRYIRFPAFRATLEQQRQSEEEEEEPSVR